MIELWMAILVFSAFHVLPSTRLRRIAIKQIGRPAFMTVYSLISFILFLWLFIAFWRAEHEGVWLITPLWLRYVSAGVMLVAFQFLAASLFSRPMVLLTGENQLSKSGSIRGVLRITRHPFLWSLVLWSLVHVINNPDPAGWSLFGYFLLLSAAGTLPIDWRRARLIDKTRWQQILHESSNIPFLAVVRGRQPLWLAFREIGWLPVAGFLGSVS